MSYLLNYKNWKSLYESQMINEAFSVLDLSKLSPSEDLKKQAIDDSNDQYEAVLQFLKDNQIVSSTDFETAAAIITVNSDFNPKSSDKSKRVMKVESQKLNPSPTNPDKILTHGNFKEDRVNQPDDVNGESDYLTIAKYLNNNLLLILLGEGDNNYFCATDSNGSMDLKIATGTWWSLYGTQTTTAAQSKEQVNTTTWTVPEEGKTIVKNLPGTLFATGAVTLADSTELDKAIGELNDLVKDKNTKITGITIESSSSGDRPVGGKSGYPNDTADLKNYPIGKPYLPKTAEESGNAKLAFGRAETIKAKLGNIAPITTKAMIQTGGDAAQYAKLIVTVEKVDKPAQTLTKNDLQSLLMKASSKEDLASTRMVKRFQFMPFK
jgi:hypothetical protein